MLLADAHVLNPDTGVVSRADVLVEGDRITAVGSGLSDDGRFDCSGGLLIPGLIDCHAHVAFPAPEPLPHSARVLEAVPVLRRLLSRGITTVRDAWGADAGMKHALAQGWITGPDVLISLRQLSPTGGLGDGWQPDVGSLDGFDDPSLPPPLFDGPTGARAAVRRMVRAGADWIKVGASGSLAQVLAGRDIGPDQDELNALVTEARRTDRHVMAHAHTPSAAITAARAGARSIEHGVFLDEEAISALHDHSCWYVPTLAVVPEGDLTTPHRHAVDLALEAGVPIAAGSDMAQRSHIDLLTELRLLAQTPLGNLGALRAATTEAARLLSLEHDRGQITPGHRADLVLLDGTDLDVTNLQPRIRAVWHNGVMAT
jgi:imidazolonepropionase-like amidohydrolase